MVKLAIIPARGGSKRINRKNIRLFHGKPIIGWSIETALCSNLFDTVLVSTDDEKIAAIAREYGAETPFARPAALSDDHIGIVPVIRHAIEWFAEHRKLPTYVCCMSATAPFAIATDLQKGFDVLIEKGAEFAVSVTRYPFPIQRAVRITENGRLSMFQPENFGTRSQDLEEAFHDAAQFYWGRAVSWQRTSSLFTESAAAVVIPRQRVQDIDTMEDWHYAETLFRVFSEGGDF